MAITNLQQLGNYFTDEYMVNGFIAKQIEANNVRLEFPSQIASLNENDFASISNKGRRDHRSMRFFTIDCVNTQDMDDAVSIERAGNGYHLQVAIADVSEFVKANTQLEAEAALRGSSIYLPGLTIPMLPGVLTNNLCSLAPMTDRYAITVEVLLDEDGSVVDRGIFKSTIRSRVKGVYEEVNDVLNGTATAGIRDKYAEVEDEIFILDELATKLNRRRIECGAETGNRGRASVVFNDGEIELELQETGRSQTLIAECMVLINTVVAEYFIENGLPAVLRAQARKGDLAEYTSDDARHESLALEHYAHFTSPIRRFADLRVHQMLSLHLAGATAAELHERFDGELAQACEQATKGVRRAKNIEHVVRKYCYCRCLDKHADEEFTGEVVGRDGKGRYLVFLDKLGLNVFASKVAGIHEGMKLAFNVSVNWKNNSMYTNNASAIAA